MPAWLYKPVAPFVRGRIVRVMLRWLGLVVLLGLLSCQSAVAASKGVVISLAEGSAGNLDQLRSAGVEWVRTFAPLTEQTVPGGTPSPGFVAEINALGARLHERNMKLAAVVTGTPSILAADPIAAPDPLSWTAIASRLVEQAAPGVDLWEIWNEPDGHEFWRNADTIPSAPAYAQLVKAAYPSFKRADPSSRVFQAGLTGQNYPYLEQLYAAGIKGSFDGISLHPDTACNITSPYLRMPQLGDVNRISQWSFLGYREAHNTMQANGDGDKPIIMTESGWSTAPGSCTQGLYAGKKPGGVSEANQATFLLRQYSCLAETPYVESAWWYNYRDQDSYAANAASNHYFGLFRADGSAKPSWAAFIRAGGPLGEPCGDFAVPTLTVEAPIDGQRFANEPLPIIAKAHDSSGIARLRVANGEDALTSWGPTKNDVLASKFPPSVSGKLVWQGAKYLGLGEHQLIVRATDGQGNIASKTITVTKVLPEELPPVATTTTLTLGRPGPRGTRKVAARVKPAQPVVVLSGVIRLYYQKWVRRGKRGRWIIAHRYSRDAKRGAFRKYKRDLAGGFRWRIIAEYNPARPPLQKSSVTSAGFRVR